YRRPTRSPPARRTGGRRTAARAPPGCPGWRRGSGRSLSSRRRSCLLSADGSALPVKCSLGYGYVKGAFCGASWDERTESRFAGRRQGATLTETIRGTLVSSEPRAERKLAAILVADVVGYSRLAGADEDRTLARLRGLRGDLIDPAIAAHHGRIVKRTGDG